MKKRARVSLGAAASVMCAAVYLVANYHPANARYKAAMQRKVRLEREREHEQRDIRAPSANYKYERPPQDVAMATQPSPEPPPPSIPKSVIKCSAASNYRSSRAVAFSTDAVSLLFVGDISFGMVHAELILNALMHSTPHDTMLHLHSCQN